jgi:hypothetical protein
MFGSPSIIMVSANVRALVRPSPGNPPPRPDALTELIRSQSSFVLAAANISVHFSSTLVACFQNIHSSLVCEVLKFGKMGGDTGETWARDKPKTVFFFNLVAVVGTDEANRVRVDGNFNKRTIWGFDTKTHRLTASSDSWEAIARVVDSTVVAIKKVCPLVA